MEIPALMLSSAEKLLEQAFRLDPEMLPALAGLSDKVMAVQLEGMAIRVYLLPHSQGISLLNHYEGETDVTVSAAPFTLLRMLATRDSSLLSSGEVVMEGDTKVAQQLMDVLAGLDIDWEEQLSKLTGDIPAHWLGNTVRHTTAWGRAQADTLHQNLSEYLHEEARLLPTGDEVAAFMDDVDSLRSDLDRLEARIARLEGGLSLE